MTRCSRPTCSRVANKGVICAVHHEALVRRGLAGRVDAAPVIEHIRKLQALGWTLDQIAVAAGTGVKVPQAIMQKGRKKVIAATRTKILSVPLEPKHSQRGVDALATRRRVRALMRFGWPARIVGPKVGMTPAVLLASIAQQRVSYALELRVKEVYKELAVEPGPSKNARALAESLGYPSPAAWTDETIGLPDARVNLTGYDEWMVRAVMRGEVVPASVPDRVEAADRLRAAGVSNSEILRLPGMHKQIVYRSHSGCGAA